MQVPQSPPRTRPQAANVSERSRPREWPSVELDVRDDLRMKREPFSRIMAAVDSLGVRETLHLRAIFEPAPLYTVLGKRGFAHETEMHSADDWSIWFWRQPAQIEADYELSQPQVSDGELILDVRGLEPPEPMVQTLSALESLPSGSTLVQVNIRVPQFLLPILAERGFEYEIAEEAVDRVVVRIRRATGNPSATDSGNHTMETVELDVRVIPPRDKHPTIFNTFDGLASGQSMVIINDHDPRPLRYQFAAERAEQFAWTYLEQGPQTWRVRIDRS